MSLPARPREPFPLPPDATAKEFPDDEIELKLECTTRPEQQVLAEAISALEEKLSIVTVPGYEIRGGAYHFDYYAAIENGAYRLAFVIVAGPRRLVRSLRRRTDPEYLTLPTRATACVLTRRGQQNQLFTHDLTGEELPEILESAAAWFGSEVVALPSLDRIVYRVVVKNEASHRYYGVIVDRSVVLGQEMSQLELEYMLGTPGVTPDFGSIEAIMTEYGQMADALFSAPLGHSLRPTTRTKFEWLVGLLVDDAHLPAP